MAATAAILRALARAVRRNLGTFGSIKVNNFFLFVALMVYGSLVSGVMPVSAYPFLLLLAFVILLPLCSDPLASIPASRRGIWPLGARERLAIRLSSLLFSPVAWVAVAILIRTARPWPAVVFGVAAAGAHGLTVPASRPIRWIPRAPGRLGELVRNHARQMFTVLDTYVAIVLALTGGAWLALDPSASTAARPVLAILVVLSLSTQAQCLFSLDSDAGRTRSQLLPLRPWQIVLAKDTAWISLLLVLTLPLDPFAGLAFGLTALAMGRHAAVSRRIPVERWRFTGGAVRSGVLQVVPGVALAMGEAAYGPAMLVPAAALYAVSLWLGGKYLFQDTVVRQ